MELLIGPHKTVVPTEDGSAVCENEPVQHLAFEGLSRATVVPDPSHRPHTQTLDALQVDSAVVDHVDEVVHIGLVQEQVHRHVPHGGIQDVRENVHVCEHVHHHRNHHMSIFDESSRLILYTGHVRSGGVHQCGHLRRPDEVVDLRPAQVQPWGVQIRVQGPVRVGGAIAAGVQVALLRGLAALLGELDGVLDVVDLSGGKEVHDVHTLEEFVVSVDILLNQSVYGQAVLLSVVGGQVVGVQGVVSCVGALRPASHGDVSLLFPRHARLWLNFNPVIFGHNILAPLRGIIQAVRAREKGL